MRHSLVTLALFAAFFLRAQVYSGLIGVQGSGHDRVLDVAYTANGDLIVQGCFNNAVTFGDTTLVADFNGDTFVGRMDSVGTWLWARNLGGQQSYGGQLIIDATGDIYALLATYRIAKLNSSGDVLWVLDQPSIQARGIGLLGTEILVVGGFNFTAIFGPDTFATPNFNNDAFLGRLSAVTGTWLGAWHLRGNGFSDAELGWGVAGTPQGDMLFTLQGESPLVFVGDDTLFSQGAAQRMYVVEMDTAGHVNWWTSSIAGAVGPPGDIVFSATGDPILMGRFSNLNFDYNGVTYPPPVLSPSDDSYVMWLGASGALQNIVFLCGQGDQQGLDLEQDGAGNLYIAGITCGPMTLGNVTLDDPAICNAFAAQMDPAGTWQWALDLAGPGNSQAFGVAVAPDGMVSMGGLFSTADVHAGAHQLVNAGSDDGFIAFVGPLGMALSAMDEQGALLWPNPARSTVWINVTSPHSEVRLTDAQGRIVRSWRPAQGTVPFVVSGLAPGLYVVHVAGRDGIRSARLLVE